MSKFEDYFQSSPEINHSLNSICPYFTMFPLSFPLNCLKGAPKENWVLDPFCGRGTVIMASRLLGMPSVGVDNNQIAAAISAVKLTSVTPYEVIERCKEILREGKEPVDLPSGEFWNRCFASETLRDICRVRETLLSSEDNEIDKALRALMIGVLHGPRKKTVVSYLSNQMPRTYASKPDYSVKYWKEHDLSPPKVKLIDVVDRRSRQVFTNMPSSTRGVIFKSDSREKIPFKPDDGFNWVITSPPYYGMKTYTQDQWLRNWFLGGPAEVDYSKDGQLSHKGHAAFIRDLSEVWKNVADVCAPNAKMVIRYGTIPSQECNAKSMIVSSLENAGCGWIVEKIELAGKVPKGRRQSEQFLRAPNKATGEIDVYAKLR